MGVRKLQIIKLTELFVCAEQPFTDSTYSAERSVVAALEAVLSEVMTLPDGRYKRYDRDWA